MGTGVGWHENLSLWKPGHSPEHGPPSGMPHARGAVPGLHSKVLNFRCSSMSESYLGVPGSISVDSFLVGLGEVHPEGGGDSVLGWCAHVLLA